MGVFYRGRNSGELLINIRRAREKTRNKSSSGTRDFEGNLSHLSGCLQEMGATALH